MISILDSLPTVVAYSLCGGVGFFVGAMTAIVALLGISNSESQQ